MRKFGLISSSLLVLLFAIGMPLTGLGQSWTAKGNMAVNGNSNGFYEYLPAGYFDPVNANKKYPVIIFIHGIGETGNGSWDLSRVLNTGLPAYINQGRFPSSFNVNGSQYSFIVICPQFVNWPGGGDVDAYYDYIMKSYRADVSRFYVTGLSMGGGATWDYVSGSAAVASKIAAIVPICGASWPNTEKCKVMADAKLPVWATHNADDPTVGVNSTISFVDGMNAFNPSPTAQKTIWSSGGHDAWSRTYDPNTKLDGVRNCYEWMLQYSRFGATPPPPPPPSTTILAWIDVKSDVTCFGANNGSASVSFNGGTGPYTYSWSTSPTQNAKTVTNLGPGSYTVTIRDANNATATATTTINEPSKLQLTVNPGTITTAGGTTSVNLSATGGTAPYTLSGPTSNVGAGTYTYSVTDSKGCTDTKLITISGPTTTSSPIVSWIDIKTDATCFGAANGSSTVSFNGGVAPFSYSWNTNPVQTAKTATNLPAGTYTVTIRDANNATATSSVSISQPSKLQLNVSAGTITTPGGNTSVSISASGGAPPYTYSGQTTNVEAGTHTYTVTDAKGCVESSTITISAPGTTISPTITAWIDIKTDPTCFGASNGNATVSFNGGVAPFTFSWSTNPVQTSKTATNLGPGTYTVTIKDANNATALATTNIGEPSKLQLVVSPGTISSTGGSTDVNLNATGGVPGYTFTGPTNGVKAGTYSYTVVDAAGCTDTKSVTITEPAPPGVSASVSGTNLTCYNGANGSAKVEVSGGTAPFSYRWNTDPVQTGATATGLKAGSYSVTVEDANKLTVTVSVNITEPSKLVLSATAGSITSFGGSTDVSLSATGGTMPYTYSGPTTGLKAGTYNYSVTDATGCTDAKSITITEPGPPALAVKFNSAANVTCNGGGNGTATASAEGGVAPYTFSWNSDPVQTEATAKGLKAGKYQVTVTDALNTKTTGTIDIAEPAKLVLAVTAGTISAYGGSTNVSLVATGGQEPYTFTGITADVKAGTYSYEVKDAAGCVDTRTITIPDATPLKLSATTSSSNVSCNGGGNGTATVSAAGGVGPYQYSWNTDPVQTGASVSGLKAGTYIVTVTDALNATTTATVNISEPAKLSLTAVAGTIATYGGTTSVSVSAIGGIEPYVFSGATADLKAGTYKYEVKDAAGCADTKTVTISDATPPQLTAKASSTNVSCNGANNGTATVSAAGGVGPYQYSWNTDPVQTGASVSGLKAGTYIVTVTDALNATTTATVNISEPAKLSLTAVAGTIASFGGTTDVTLTATGGSVPYDFTGVTSNLKAGTYSFEVKDAAGCKDGKSVTITEPAQPIQPIQPTQPAPLALAAVVTDTRNISCNGAANGSATVSASGGVSPYSYTWNTIPARTGATATELKAGTYVVTVTDAVNTTTTATVKISEPSLLALSATAAGIPANGGTTNVDLNATGGTAPYVYSGQTSGLAPGSYTYSVTDAAGCNATASVLIGQPSRLDLKAVAGAIKCNGGTTDVVLTATGGTPPYEFEGNTKDLKAGVYNFTVTDAARTKSNVTIQIKDPAVLELVVNPGAIKRVGGTTFVDINARGGTMPYAFSGEVSNLQAGTYTYSVTDANSCTATASIEVKEPKVNLAAFDVGTVDTSVRINWKTSYEYAIDHFTIEKSTDGASFNPIGAVNSRWSAASLFDYIMNDVKPSPAKNVYRIAAVTIYGEKLILQEKSIMFTELSKISMKNMAERLEVSISSNLEENINFTLFDMNGKALKSIQARKDVYTLRTTIITQDLPRGTYVLRILSPTIKSSKQVIRL